jgi:Ca2+-binding EF-hand superfamily protein
VIESMKNNEHIANVIKHQQNAKRKEAIRVLTLLQFFLDKADALANIDEGSGAQMQNRDVDSAFEAMTKDAHSQHMIEELRTLFHTYDVDNSGQIDKEELGDLLATMGQPKSEEELSRLFNMMDADGSGDVDFKEFATVIMHNRNCKHSLDTADIARRMWQLFDTDGDGTISPDEMLATFSTPRPLSPCTTSSFLAAPPRCSFEMTLMLYHCICAYIFSVSLSLYLHLFS